MSATNPNSRDRPRKGTLSKKDRIEEAKALLASAQARIAYLEEENPEKSKEKYEQALGIYRDLGRKEDVANTLVRLSRILDGLEEYREAIGHLEEALEIYKSMRDKLRIGNSLNFLGELLTVEGEYSRAETCLKEALMYQKDLEDKGGIAETFFNLGEVFEKIGVLVIYWSGFDVGFEARFIFTEVAPALITLITNHHASFSADKKSDVILV